MNFTIRRMKQEDLAQVEAIEKKLFSIPWSRVGFLGSLAQDNTIYLVAEEADTGQIAGYCGLYQMLDEADITNVAIDLPFQRKHLAQALIEELLKQGADMGVSAFTLEVRKSNHAAIALYEKKGFQAVGVRTGFYQKPPEDAVIMWKR